MNVAAIVAEYNPFHNGHAYQIAETRRQTGADYLLVIMSGDFVQRGEPALLNKYVRARMALQNGADLVLELPAAYACASAETFAAGAVATLHRLGVVDTLSYGSEYPQEELFSQLAGLYLHEPAAFSQILRRRLKEGYTYPQARAAATDIWLAQAGLPACPPGLLSSPNSILAIEYHKALLSLDCGIRPLAIRRRGGYHDTSLPQTAVSRTENTLPGDRLAEQNEFASASAIRRLLLEKDVKADKAAARLLSAHVPADVLEILCTNGRFMTAGDFSAALGFALLDTPPERFCEYADINGDLGDRMARFLLQYQGWQAFTDLIKTRQMTRSRISRAFLHLLLRIRQEQLRQWAAQGYVYYARVLGFRRQAAPLLTAVKKKSSVLLLTKMAAAKRNLDSWYQNEPSRQTYAQQLLETDLRAAALYETMAAVRWGGIPEHEYRHGLILVDG